jgi:hypothetical protein
MAPHEPGESSAGDFIFVNHNAKRLRPIKDRSQRAIINQHVQKAWMKNKKPKDQTLTQRPKSSNTTQRISDELTPESDLDPSNGAYPTPPHQPPPSKANSLIKFRPIRPRKPRRRKHDELGLLLPPYPITPLTNGNTDPFSTLAVPFDSTVSHLLQHSKDVMLPTVYSMELRATTPSLGLTQAWDHVRSSFEDECAMSAYLAISATSLLRIAPKSADLARVALRFNNRSSALLRQRLADSQDSIDPRLYTIVLWLSSNALATGDFTAGMIHANTLCFLVKQGGGIAKVEPFQREHILQFDVQFAMMFLKRPFFAAEDYAPGPFEMRWLNDKDAVDNPSPSNRLIAHSPLTPSILSSPALASTLTGLRTLHAVYTFTFTNRLPGTSPIFRWMYLSKHATEARLLEICCERIYSPITPTSHLSPDSSSETDSIEDLVPSLCIAALYWIAMAVGFSREKIHACSLSLSHLRSTLATALPAFQSSTSPLLLWILYVGTTAERALGLSQLEGPWRDWCTVRFMRQVKLMRINGWEECKSVLEGVVFDEGMHAEGGQGEIRRGDGEEELGRRLETGFERWWIRVSREFGGVDGC